MKMLNIVTADKDGCFLEETEVEIFLEADEKSNGFNDVIVRKLNSLKDGEFIYIFPWK